MSGDGRGTEDSAQLGGDRLGFVNMRVVLAVGCGAEADVADQAVEAVA